MKQFFKALFTHIFALCLFFGGIMFLGVAFIAGVAATGERKVSVESDSILHFNMSLVVTDSVPGFDTERFFAQLQGRGDPQRISLRAVVDAINAAAIDRRIRALYMSGNLIEADYGSGLAALREVRQAIERFRATGKPVVSYFINASDKDYYLASAGDEIVLHPSGAVGLVGLGSQQVFLKGMFEKYGIGITVVRTGAYKSAAESFTRDSFSNEERLQLTELLGALWDDYVATVAHARGIEPAEFQRIVDAGIPMLPREALATGIVTRLAKEDEMHGDLAELVGKDREDEFNEISVQRYAQHIRSGHTSSRRSGGHIAVVYAEGVIVDGVSSPGNLGADTFVETLREIHDDDDVRALVLRVNSPGGSGLASDRMLDAIRSIRDRGIPVVVSMGTVAASGGYYISMESDRILVQPNTITGSIGVIGLIPDFEELARRQGITTDRVETGRFATSGSLLRRMDPVEVSLLQRSVDDFYQQFLEVVSKGRKMPIEAVHQVAQGRVWSGPAAIDRGLADQIGGLTDAINQAATLAGLGTSFRVVEYPRPMRFEDFIEDLMKASEPLVRIMVRQTSSHDPVSILMRGVQEQLQLLRSLNDPRGVYMLMPHRIGQK
jgi:protease-4